MANKAKDRRHSKTLAKRKNTGYQARITGRTDRGASERTYNRPLPSWTCSHGRITHLYTITSDWPNAGQRKGPRVGTPVFHAVDSRGDGTQGNHAGLRAARDAIGCTCATKGEGERSGSG